MTPLPRPEGVGGRAGAIGASAHLNGSNPMPATPPHDFAIPEGDSAMIIAYGACALSGFIVGLLLGLAL